MKQSYLPLLFALSLSGCSLTDLPDDDLIPMSGREVMPDLEEENPEEAWSHLASLKTDLPPLRKLDTSELGGDLGVTAVFPDYNREPVSGASRIFLVAGGASVATYLQEVIVQRDYWLSQGYSGDQIACYYVKPEKEDYMADQARFDALAARADGFYLAAPHVLFKHLKDLAPQNPSMVYLYVTGAGKAPASSSPEELALAAQFPEFAGCYRIVLRGGPSGHMNERMRLEALRDGIDAHYLVFNAEFLADALRALPGECERYVVLNGDYSGGFLSSASGDDGQLRTVPHTTVIASARHDRKAMGGGGELTAFGGLYLSAISTGSGKVEARSWRRVANELMVTVDKAEQSAGVGQGGRSRPVFFSALDRESGPLAEMAANLTVPPVPEMVEEPAPEKKVAAPAPGKLLPTSGAMAAANPAPQSEPVVGAAVPSLPKPRGEVETVAASQSPAAPKPRVVPEPVVAPKPSLPPQPVAAAGGSPVATSEPTSAPPTNVWSRTAVSKKATVSQSAAAPVQPAGPVAQPAAPKAVSAPRSNQGAGAALGMGRAGFGR